MAKKNYALESSGIQKRTRAPDLPYRPRDPKRYNPTIGLIACGGITATHLTAYKKAGYKVVALCDVDREKAEIRRKEFYPRAEVYEDYRRLLKRDDVEVVDVAAHPAERVGIIRDCLKSGRHVLSQKPFALDLDAGRRLVDLAHKHRVKLAVNQNGRWAPHFSYMRHAIDAGLIGDVIAVHMGVHWDHNWIKGTAFDSVRHIILYDFAIHWFDILTTFMGGRVAKRVYASFTRSPGQEARPALLAQALVEYEGAQATLAFDGDVRYGKEDRTYIAGTGGTLTSEGPDLGEQTVTLQTAGGVATPRLRGAWFPDGFHGTMAELLCAIEKKREPSNSAEGNLRSLGLCFAAVASAETGEAKVPGRVKRVMG